MVHGGVMGLAIHDLPLVRALLPRFDDVEVLSAHASAPLGYHIVLTAGGKRIELHAAMTATWRPDWVLEAFSDDQALRIEFSPSVRACRLRHRNPPARPTGRGRSDPRATTATRASGGPWPPSSAASSSRRRCHALDRRPSLRHPARRCRGRIGPDAGPPGRSSHDHAMPVFASDQVRHAVGTDAVLASLPLSYAATDDPVPGGVVVVDGSGDWPAATADGPACGRRRASSWSIRVSPNWPSCARRSTATPPW